MRRAVRRFAGCLALLPATQRRVLRLRAGAGSAAPASRVEVADRLDVTVRRVRRAERRGLRTLRRAGAAGCARVDRSGGHDDGSAYIVLPPDAGHAAPGLPIGSAEASGRADGSGRGSREARGGTAPAATGDVRGVMGERPAPPRLPAQPGESPSELLLLGLLGLVVALSLLIARRRPETPG